MILLGFIKKKYNATFLIFFNRSNPTFQISRSLTCFIVSNGSLLTESKQEHRTRRKTKPMRVLKCTKAEVFILRNTILHLQIV